MSEGQKRKTALQEIKELRGAIEPSKNDVIAQRALDLAEYYLIHAENQAGHIQRLEERNKRMRGKWVKLYEGNYKCSECGDWWGNDDNDMVENFHYCPNCGAWMGGDRLRTIDADELKTAFPCGESVRTECVRATIDHMPTIEPQRMRGRWIPTEPDEPCFYQCSICRRLNDEKDNFCKNCGAKMEGTE